MSAGVLRAAISYFSLSGAQKKHRPPGALGEAGVGDSDMSYLETLSQKLALI